MWGGFGWFGFGRPGTRVAAGHSRSSYTWRRARAPHPSRSWDRRRPPRGPPPRTPWPFAWTSSFTRLCTAVVDDGGAARVSPARVGAVRRGCARVSPLGRDAGLLLELRTVVDCFRSGRWGRAGVRSGRRVTCVGRKKDTRRVQHNTRPAKRPVRAGRGTTRPELGPGDDRRVIDVARRPCPHRHRERRGVPVARARPPGAPCRSEKSRIWLHSGDCTHPLASVDSPWRTARDLYCGRSRRANTAEGLYPSASATSRPAPSPMAPTAGSSGRYLRWKSFGVALESTRVEFPDEKV